MEYERGINLKVRDLKDCLKDLPDDMDVIIPVCDENNENFIHGFRHARTIGILEHPSEKDPALCIAISRDGADMHTLMDLYRGDTSCTKVLF